MWENGKNGMCATSEQTFIRMFWVTPLVQWPAGVAAHNLVHSINAASELVHHFVSSLDFQVTSLQPCRVNHLSICPQPDSPRLKLASPSPSCPVRCSDCLQAEGKELTEKLNLALLVHLAVGGLVKVVVVHVVVFRVVIQPVVSIVAVSIAVVIPPISGIAIPGVVIIWDDVFVVVGVIPVAIVVLVVVLIIAILEVIVLGNDPPNAQAYCTHEGYRKGPHCVCDARDCALWRGVRT